MFKKPDYPDILTNDNWQKKKGAIAKLAGGETGIGDLLKKLKTTYDDVTWARFDFEKSVNKPAKEITEEDIKEVYAAARKEYPKVQKVEKAARDVEDEAAKVAVAWAKSKTIPKSSTQHAEAVGKAAKQFSYAAAMGTISAAFEKDMKEAIEINKKYQAGMKALNDKLRRYVDTFESASKGVTLDTYAELWKENIRGVGTVLPTLVKDHPEVKTEWEIWKKFSNVFAKPASEEELNKQIAILVKVAHSLKPKIKDI